MKLLPVVLLALLCLVLAGPASAQAPGSFAGAPCFATFDLVEPAAGEPFGPLPLPCAVFGGYVVLLESAAGSSPQDPRNWSDVVAFTTGGPVQPGQPTDHVFFISDSADPATGVENGITPADLAPAGLTLADILGNTTTVYLVEGANTIAGDPSANIYDAVGPLAAARYIIHSDPPEPPVATDKSTWGRVKGLYR